MAKDTATGTVAKNRRARFDYAIEDTLECGLVLTGTEVKAMRAVPWIMQLTGSRRFRSTKPATTLTGR